MPVCSQPVQVSFSTDFSVQRSLKKEQQYWAIGQTIRFDAHFNKKSSLIVLLSYYSPGKFNNDLIAVAKSPATIPQQLFYKNKSSISLKHFSLGTRYFLKGAYDAEKGTNIYGTAGLGLTFAKVENSNVLIDTADYRLPVFSGTSAFKRLTVDLSLGIEQPVGGDIFLFGEGKIQLPSSGYPSNYLLVNKDAPLPVFFNVGLRILFGFL